MKAQIITLGRNDSKGIDFTIASLAVCAQDHILSKKLLHHVSVADGSFIAISPPWLNLDQIDAYDRGAMGPVGDRYEDGYYPQALLIAFVQDYLRANGNRIVVSENFGLKRKSIALLEWPPPRLACYGDNDVFHILTPDITDPAQVEAAIIDRHHWQTGVCSIYDDPRDWDIVDEGFVDGVVRNTIHIFLPAFDSTGYLIWSKNKAGD